MNWIIAGIFIVLVFLFLRFKHMKHKIIAIFLIISLLFIYSTASTLFQGEDIEWKSFAGLEKAGKIYFSWLGNALTNLRSLSGNAIKMDWQIPENETLR